MTVTLTGTGGLFTRLGKIFKLADRIHVHQQDATAGIKKEIQDIVTEYDADDAYMLLGLASQTLALQQSSASPMSVLASVARNTVIEMVHNDDPLPEKTIERAIERLIEQMRSASQSVNDTTIGGSSFAGTSNTGNGNPLFSLKDQIYGEDWQNTRDEDMIITCISDAQISGTAGRETFSVEGEPALSDITHPEWPGGTGVGTSIRVSDPSESPSNSAGRTILTNGSFENFSVTNTPDNWTIGTGSAGTTIFEDGAVKYRLNKSLAIQGNGAELTSLSQSFRTAGNTVQGLNPRTRYCLTFRVSCDAGMAAGVLRISVKDGAGNILDSGSAYVSVTLSGVSTGGTFDQQYVTFNSPLYIPSGTKVVVELTTAATNTKKVCIDELMLVPMYQLGGNSGNFCIMTPGSTPFVREDWFRISPSNNRDGLFQKWFDKMFGMYAMGMQLPYAAGGAETISDSLIS